MAFPAIPIYTFTESLTRDAVPHIHSYLNQVDTTSRYSMNELLQRLTWMRWIRRWAEIAKGEEYQNAALDEKTSQNDTKPCLCFSVAKAFKSKCYKELSMVTHMLQQTANKNVTQPCPSQILSKIIRRLLRARGLFKKPSRWLWRRASCAQAHPVSPRSKPQIYLPRTWFVVPCTLQEHFSSPRVRCSPRSLNSGQKSWKEAESR